MSELTITGVVKQILPEETGVSKSGKDWKKQDFVIETDDKYPKPVCFTLFGDKTDLLMKIAEGQTVDVSFNVESREFNGKWFHNLNAWKILTKGSNNVPEHPVEYKLPPSESLPTQEDEDVDLPF